MRAIVAARLDALPPEERSVLVDASVVGRVFWRGAVAGIAERPDLATALGSLEERDFIRREAVSRITGEQQFAFKHAVIRDVAYERLPRAARRERHAAVARFLEERTGDVGQATEAIAQHWREAGENRRALDCLVVAADQAGRGWAKQHAVTLYRAALALVDAEDEELRRDLTRQAGDRRGRPLPRRRRAPAACARGLDRLVWPATRAGSPRASRRAAISWMLAM